MFTEFKKNCISSNDRLINKDVDTPYDWCHDSNDYELEPVMDEQDQLLTVADAPNVDITKNVKSLSRRTNPEREVCSYCGKTFLFLSQHIKSMHSGTISNTKKFTCGLCFERFTER